MQTTGIRMDERVWAALAHLSGLTWLFGIPFGGSIASTIVYAIKHHASPYVAHHAREAQNFQNTIGMAMLLASGVWAIPFLYFLIFARGESNGVAALDGVIIFAGLLILLVVWDIGAGVFAALAAFRGYSFEYPLNVRLLPRVPAPLQLAPPMKVAQKTRE
jgi:uncharacterized Tic20 family protein